MPMTGSTRSCQRCRKSRVSCEETQSICSDCTKEGDDSLHSTTKLRWSRKHEKFHPYGGRFELNGTDNATEPLVLGTDRQSRMQKRRPAHVSALEPSPGVRQQNQQHHGQTLPRAPQTPLTNAQGLASTSAESNNSLINTTPIFTPNSSLTSVTSYSGRESGSSSDRFEDSDYLHESIFWGMGLPLSGTDLQLPLDKFQGPSHDPFTMLPSVEYGHISEFASSLMQPVTPPSSIRHTTRGRLERAPADARSLLGAFYRLQSPTSIAQFSEEHLVRHYFNNVCALFSCYDSDMNPFRTSVASLWTTSGTIYLAIQSMAIAHLSNHYHYMAPLGRRKLAMAWKSFQLDLQLYRRSTKSFDEIMMSLLLLGLSASWHSPKVLELQFLLIARNIMQVYLQNPLDEAFQVSVESEQFFVDAILHWEMLASFVEPTPMVCFPGFGSPIPTLPDEQRSRLPHPWTGVSTELHLVLAEIGRVLRRVRQQSSSLFHSRTMAQKSDEEVWVSSLEQFLYSLKIPEAGAILDYGDADTPKNDLVRMGQAQRLFGLLEIYNAFPNLMSKRLDRCNEFIAALDLRKLDPVDCSLWPGTEGLETWQCMVAIHTLDLVEKVPITSGACRLQPLVLTSCASYLHLPEESEANDQTLQTHLETVYEARYFVEARLLALSRKYPQRPILRLLDVVKEQWQRSTEDSDTRWIQIALEKGFEMVG